MGMVFCMLLRLRKFILMSNGSLLLTYKKRFLYVKVV